MRNAPSAAKAISTASSTRFMTVMTLIASDIPRKFSALKTRVVARIRRGIETAGQK